MHLVRHCHLPSRDKDGTHAIGSAVPYQKTPMLHANLTALSWHKLKKVLKLHLTCNDGLNANHVTVPSDNRAHGINYRVQTACRCSGTSDYR